MSVCRRQPIEAAIECIVLGHRLAVEISELAQHQSVGDPFAQLAIVPVLDAHENQRAQDLLRRQPAATAPRLLQTSHQIAPDPLDHLLLVVKEVGNRLQQRLQTHALPHQFPIGKADLSLPPLSTLLSSLFLLFAAFARSRFNALT